MGAITRNPSGAVRDDITVPQGAAWSRTWAITDPLGNPLNVDNWTVRAQIRYSHDDLPFFEWNTAGGVGIGTASATGTDVTIHLSGAETPTWLFGSAVYDVVLRDPGGIPTRIVEGQLTLSPSITHS
jgi:hypothetical protein